MTLVRWKPFGDVMNLHNQINRLFDDRFFGEREDVSHATSSWSPVTDVFETKDEYVFKLEVPGMDKDDISVEFIGDNLSIKGEKKEEVEVKKESYHRIESYSGNFCRSFNIPKNVNTEKIKASMKSGVLQLRIPKVEAAKAKSIQIDVK